MGSSFKKILAVYNHMLIRQAAEIHRYQLTYAGLLHGYTVDHIHRAHGLFIVCYNNEL